METQNEKEEQTMTSPTANPFDATIHKSYEWLKDLMYEIGTEDQNRAYAALRGTLQSLRDRLTVEEATDLGAQLPMLIRGLYYEGWNPVHTPEKIRDRDEFLQKVAAFFTQEPGVDAEHMVRAVFKIMFFKLDEGQVEQVKNILPKEISSLYPQPDR
jgi:uncharacterized protein (DUF2267 family)